MTKLDYEDKITKIFAMGDDIITINTEKMAITADQTILENFHLGEKIRITITTEEEN